MSDPASLKARYRRQLLDKLPSQVRSLSLDFPFGSDVTQVASASRLLTPRQLEITSLEAVDLLDKIAKRQYSSEEVTLAFGLRAAIAHRLTCCLTDYWLEEALERARELDHYLEQEGKTIGPLHGLPISLKDQFEVSGHVTSLSYLSKHVVATPSPQSSLFVCLLERSGAITYCHTNLPQTIMHLSTSSFWGTCLNPFNTSLTPGGSSGGESALIALRGSPIGLGTDIGGSVRSPAANCGLWALRPTSGRLPSATPAVPGRDSIVGTSGPIARSLRDLDAFMNVVLGEQAAPWEHDPSLLEMAWNGGGRKGGWQDGKRRLRIGVMWNDGEVSPIRPVQRAMETTVHKLKHSGEIDVVDVEPWRMREGWELTRQLYFADGGKRIHELLDESNVGEPLEPLTRWLLEEAGREPLKDHSVQELWALNIRRDSYRASFRKYWNDLGVDVVLSPVAPTPAPKHGQAKWWAYTSHWNVVDHPALVFPTGLTVDPALDDEPTVREGEWKNDDEKLVHQSYTPDDYRNAPLGLQLVARKYHDEEVIEAMKVVERVLHGSKA